MAYVTTNPPHLTTEGPLTGAGQVWSYSSADAAATVAGANYFSDGASRGMKVNDIVNVIDTASALVTAHRVTALSGTAADVGTGTVIGITAG